MVVDRQRVAISASCEAGCESSDRTGRSVSEKAPLQNDFGKTPDKGRTGIEFSDSGQLPNIRKKNCYDKKRMRSEGKLRANGLLTRGYDDWMSGLTTFAAILRNVPRRNFVRLFILLTTAVRLLL